MYRTKNSIITFFFGLSLLTTPSLTLAHEETQVSANNPALSQMTKPYLQIQESLAKDSLEGISTQAREILKTVEASDQNLPHEMKDNISKAARQLARAKDLKTARASFSSLSAPFANWVEQSKPQDLETVYCPMKKEKWVQKKGEIRNPYFGKKMESCGEKQS